MTDEAESARNILASMLCLGHLLEVKPREDIRTWHRSHLSIGESFALLWQQEAQGGTVEPRSASTSARFLAAHLADLLLAGRLKLLWDSPEGQKKQLSFLVVSTEPVSVPATTALLQELYVRQENRRVNKKKRYTKSIQRFLEQLATGTELATKLEKETFAGLVERKILAKEKQKKWNLLTKEIPPNAHLELVLKLIGRTTQVFTLVEEHDNPKLAQLREKFVQDPMATLMGVEPIGSAMVLMDTTHKKDLKLWRLGNDEIYVENSPFLADEEQSLRFWKAEVDEGVMS
ncbi:expressed unknown protein [Seminavis robusta]|uniref:Uncharacterized protein n=1 Tax=Seminavis robusta TaxID=568900 RepID=A0A9N8HX62_9STRA|nr:expressed unknown protein [Seminavis robusta]|eukprot:Sro2938_g340620.1 n/a (289) ;mRNA; f:694-1631